MGEVRLLGDRALLIGVDAPAAARALAGALEQAGTWGSSQVEYVCGFATLMVVVTDPELDPEPGAVREVVAHALADPAVAGARREPGRAMTVPCVFDGPDLDEVASLAGTDARDVVRLLTGSDLTVAVMGFSPGFAYLDGLPAPLARVPRRATPRPAVPAGSVALANGHAAVYPTASPGGWQLVGRTGFPFFSTTDPPYAALAPGDTVRFRAATAGEAETDDPVPPAATAWSPPPGSRPVLDVARPGLRAVLQDGGRAGMAAIGVPAAGPADPWSFLLANRLVGNADAAGALEIVAGGTALRCLGPCHVAAAGGAPELRVDGTAEPAGQVLPLQAGQLLEVGRLRGGCRTYLAVAGGLLGPRLFGSCASDELSGLGQGLLGVGHRLHAAPWAPPLGDHLMAGVASEIDPARPVDLRVVPGPHAERFDAALLSALPGRLFTVDQRSNRVGLRLRAAAEGDRDAAGSGGGEELDSQGVVTGVIQLPPGGEPVVLLPDHATLGGYPVLAVVASADHGLLGQCGPGTVVRLVPVDVEEALAARRQRRRALERAVIGHYPVTAG